MKQKLKQHATVAAITLALAGTTSVLGRVAIERGTNKFHSSSYYAHYVKGIDTSTEAGLRKMARAVAVQEGIDPDLFESLIEVESSFNPDAKSNKGAIGLGQIMPMWASHFGFTHVSELWAAYNNLKAAALIYKGYLADQGGNVRAALEAYNGDNKCVGKCTESINHAKKVLELYAVKILARKK